MAAFYPQMKTLTMELLGSLQPLPDIITQAVTHISTYYGPIDAAYSEYRGLNKINELIKCKV